MYTSMWHAYVNNACPHQCCMFMSMLHVLVNVSKSMQKNGFSTCWAKWSRWYDPGHLVRNFPYWWKICVRRKLLLLLWLNQLGMRSAGVLFGHPRSPTYIYASYISMYYLLNLLILFLTTIHVIINASWNTYFLYHQWEFIFARLDYLIQTSLKHKNVVCAEVPEHESWTLRLWMRSLERIDKHQTR
jgi:hypothetical protein